MNPKTPNSSTDRPAGSFDDSDKTTSDAGTVNTAAIDIDIGNTPTNGDGTSDDASGTSIS